MEAILMYFFFNIKLIKKEEAKKIDFEISFSLI
jgi:hypothetical protein